MYHSNITQYTTSYVFVSKCEHVCVKDVKSFEGGDVEEQIQAPWKGGSSSACRLLESLSPKGCPHPGSKRMDDGEYFQ